MSFTYKIPVPSLKCVSQETAEREGYVELTVPISPRNDGRTFDNIQKQLAGTDSVWIEHKGDKFAAGRKQSELLAVEALVDADQRRGRKNEKQTPST